MNIFWPSPASAVIAIQTFDDFLGFNPHCLVLVTDGGFYGRGMFRVAPSLEMKKPEAVFRQEVFRRVLALGRITEDLIPMLSNWRHSGFHGFCGKRIFRRDETALENLARYIIRASFSPERMQVLAEPLLRRWAQLSGPFRNITRSRGRIWSILGELIQ